MPDIVFIKYSRRFINVGVWVIMHSWSQIKLLVKVWIVNGPFIWIYSSNPTSLAY